MTLDTFLTDTREQLESALADTFQSCAHPRLTQAIHYSLLAGGKRLRPALVRAAAELAGDHSSRWLTPAQAVEMIHVYSLIHDDLPAMDNDDLRHGKATNHRQFDEATAILAGDALHSEAFAIIARASELDDIQARGMTLELAKSAGASGMVGGQMIDLLSEQQQLNPIELAKLHRLKTGALIRCALILGAHCTSHDHTMLAALVNYGEALGLAFQITDDILDVTAPTEVLGKPQGSDMNAQKSTYVSLLGLEGARQQALAQYNLATAALRQLDLTQNSLLWQLAEYVIQRDH